MNIEQLELITKTVLPLISDAGNLLSRLVSGGAGMTSAKAELKGILVVAMDRLSSMDVEFAKRDREEDARVKGADPTPGWVICQSCRLAYPFGTKHTCAPVAP